MGIVGKAAGALVALAIIGGIAKEFETKAPPESAAERRAEDKAIHKAQAVERVKQAIRSVLRDPASAQFSNVDQLSNGVVCGHVNARNGFGGMTGPKDFLFDPNGSGLMMEEEGETRFYKVWDVKCAEQSQKDYSGTRRLTPEQHAMIMKSLTPSQRSELKRLESGKQ